MYTSWSGRACDFRFTTSLKTFPVVVAVRWHCRINLRHSPSLSQTNAIRKYPRRPILFKA